MKHPTAQVSLEAAEEAKKRPGQKSGDRRHSKSMLVQVDSINLFAFFDCWACGPNEKLGVQDVQKQCLLIRKHILPKQLLCYHEPPGQQQGWKQEGPFSLNQFPTLNVLECDAHIAQYKIPFEAFAGDIAFPCSAFACKLVYFFHFLVSSEGQR